jgi:hypothetical protein
MELANKINLPWSYLFKMMILSAGLKQLLILLNASESQSLAHFWKSKIEALSEVL